MGQSSVIVPNRHNYCSDASYFHSEPAEGVLRDPYARRLTRVSIAFLSSLHSNLVRQFGEGEAAEILYKLGQRWGESEFAHFTKRAPREFGVMSLDQMPFNVMLETWRWPLTTQGWGTWRYDLQRARNGLIGIELETSAEVAAVGRSERPVCSLYAGFFAATFSALARRDLAAVELRCAANGPETCRFVVTIAARARTAARLRDEGLSASEVLDALMPANVQSEASTEVAS